MSRILIEKAIDKNTGDPFEALYGNEVENGRGGTLKQTKKLNKQ